MGENKHIEELDTFSRKYIQEIVSDNPSVNFTANIINTILKEGDSTIYKVSPLIPKRVWGVLVTILVGAIAFVAQGTSLSWVKLPKFNLSFISKIQLPNLFEGLTVSNTMLYACFFFTIMIFVQIYFLKNHFAKKINM